MRPLYALVSTLGLVFLAAPVSASAADLPASSQDCAPEPCGTINTVCWKAFHVNCVRSADPSLASGEARCMGPVCEAINTVCYIALKQWCVG